MTNRDVRRIDRYRRLSEAQREALWPVFEQVRAGLLDRGLITWAEMFGRLTGELALRESLPFRCVVVDEALLPDSFLTFASSSHEPS